MTVFGFEAIGDDLPILPLAARRALDAAGLKLSLGAWRTVPVAQRWVVVRQGAGSDVDLAAVRAAIVGAVPEPKAFPPVNDDRLATMPPGLPPAWAARVAGAWEGLGVLKRFAIAHVACRSDPARLVATLTELLPSAAPPPAGPGGLTHLDAKGQARMVDVGDKPVTHRRAVASARVRLQPATARMVADGTGPKGDVLAVARVAGIMAAKRTPDLIPLCHGIALQRVVVSFEVAADEGVIAVTAIAEARDRTGVEMEAMVAASVAALTIYDMLKAVERGIVIDRVLLEEKSGGRSGHYQRGTSGSDEEPP